MRDDLYRTLARRTLSILAILLVPSLLFNLCLLISGLAWSTKPIAEFWTTGQYIVLITLVFPFLYWIIYLKIIGKEKIRGFIFFLLLLLAFLAIGFPALMSMVGS